MPAKQLVTAAIENAFNAVINHQARPQAVLQKLKGKRLTIFLDIMPGGLSLVFDDRVLVINGPSSFAEARESIDSHTCIIQTKLAVLPELSKTSQLTALIQRGDLNLIGDLSIAQNVSELLNETNLDLEEQLARRTSDVFAHSVFSVFGSIHKRATSVLTALSYQGAELIVEERPIAARKQAVSGFSQQVTALRDDVERLAVKIRQYEQAVLAQKDVK